MRTKEKQRHYGIYVNINSTHRRHRSAHQKLTVEFKRGGELYGELEDLNTMPCHAVSRRRRCRRRRRRGWRVDGGGVEGGVGGVARYGMVWYARAQSNESRACRTTRD